MIFEPDEFPIQPEPFDAYRTNEFSVLSLERVDEVCLLFEKKWQSGMSPDLESYLDGFNGALRSALFSELLLLDIEYRTRSGEKPEQSDYATRFPQETPVIESAFRSNQALASGCAERTPETQNFSLTSEFQLRQFHARGGLGVVYVAYDEKLGRNVAVKFSRHRNPGSTTQRRLAREAEITGRLEHPGIVPVYATGNQKDGSPCYVMQLVEGRTFRVAIDEFHANAKSQNNERFASLKFRQLVQKLIAVCNTVAYAHDQQVIHRDIKPSNIMLGNFGETFLLDWGLAKSLESNEGASEAKSGSETHIPESETEQASPTMTGQQIGTPAFASPEQAMGRIHEHDIRTDVFALGATLYYLLVGKGPVETDRCDVEETSQSYHDIQKPRSIDKRIPRELDSICCKAISFDPDLRYESAAALGNDLERYLADESISVVSEPWTAHFRRWVRKNPWKVVAVASSLMIGLISLGVGSWLLGQKNLELTEINTRLVESRKSERIARTNTKQALRSLTDNAIAKWLASGDKLTPADEQFLQSILRQYQAFADAEPEDVEAAETKAEGYYRVAQLHKILSNRDEAIATCLSGLEFIEQLESPPSDKLLQVKSAIQSFAGTMLAEIGKWQQAKSLSVSAVETASELTKRNPESMSMILNHSQRLGSLGKIHMRCREYESAADHFRQSLEILEGFPEDQQEKLAWRKHAAMLNQVLGLTLENLGQTEEAAMFLVRSLDFHDEVSTNSSSIQEQIGHFRTRATLAAIQLSLNQNAAAEANLDMALLQAEKIQAEYPMLTGPLIDIGNIWFQKCGICFDKRQYRQSIEHGEKAIQSFERLLDKLPDDLFCMNCLSNAYGLQAGSYSSLDELEPAIDHSLTALEFAKKLYAAHPAAYRNELVTRFWFAARIHHQYERYAEVREFGSQALSLIEVVEDTERRSQFWDKEIGFHQLLGWSLMFFNQNQQAIEQWQSIIDKTKHKPMVGDGGEDMHVVAQIEKATCLAAFEPERAIVDIQELAKRDDLMSAQVYELSCAAAAASKNVQDTNRTAVAETLALQLLRRTVEDNLFTSEAQFDKRVRQKSCFSSLIDYPQFLQIEQSIEAPVDH